MTAKLDDDKNLHEVKTVLRRLQRIGDDLPPAEAAGRNTGNAMATLQNLVDRKGVSQAQAKEQVPAHKRPTQGKRLGALALAMIAAATVIVLAGDLLLKYWPAFSSSKRDAPVNGVAPASPAMIEGAGTKIFASKLPNESRQPVPQAETTDRQAASPANPAIGNARQLMDGGHIVAARQLLRQPDLTASQDGAWLLARSYDPNYLATIQSPDAAADKVQAEEWYRHWRDIGVRNGMVMDDLRLKRIIESMQ
jgi:hypothetical protein